MRVKIRPIEREDGGGHSFRSHGDVSALQGTVETKSGAMRWGQATRAPSAANGPEQKEGGANTKEFRHEFLEN